MMQMPSHSPVQHAPQAFRAPPGPSAAGVSWAQDFQRMQLGSQANANANAHGAIRDQQQQQQMGVAPARPEQNHATLNHMGRSQPWIMQPDSMGMVRPMNIAQRQMGNYQMNAQNFLQHAPDGAVLPTPITSHHYPKELELAATSNEALESAFAAYDQDFQAEMDNWVESHPPTGRDEARREAFMSEFEWEQAWKRENYASETVATQDPEAIAKRKIMQDQELQKAAQDTLQAVNGGEEKSAELRKKIEQSAFVGLMGRLSSGEVAVNGNDLIDNTTGETIDQGARDFQTDDTQIEHEVLGATTTADNGKGKEKAQGLGLGLDRLSIDDKQKGNGTFERA